MLMTSWEYATNDDQWNQFSQEACTKLDEAFEKGLPTVLLSNNPTVFVNLRTFTLRNTSNEYEACVRKRLQHREGKDYATLKLREQSNNASDVVNGWKIPFNKQRAPEQPTHGRPTLSENGYIACKLEPKISSDSPQPGRFALAWQAETEQMRNRVQALVQTILSSFQPDTPFLESESNQRPTSQSNLKHAIAAMRNLGALLAPDLQARRCLAAMPALPALIDAQSRMLATIVHAADGGGNDIDHDLNTIAAGAEAASAVLASMLGEPAYISHVQRPGPAQDRILVGLLGMVAGSAAAAASCGRGRHAVFALQALTEGRGPAGGVMMERLMALRREMRDKPRAVRRLGQLR